jgi:hypothetical protein
MTCYEHAMLGGTLALALGAYRRRGWSIVVMAAVATALPDWDGLSFAFGPLIYGSVHRVWGHNLLIAVAGGAVVGCLGLLCDRSARVQRQAHVLLRKLGQTVEVRPFLPRLSVHEIGV